MVYCVEKSSNALKGPDIYDDLYTADVPVSYLQEDGSIASWEYPRGISSKIIDDSTHQRSKQKVRTIKHKTPATGVALSFHPRRFYSEGSIIIPGIYLVRTYQVRFCRSTQGRSPFNIYLIT